MRRDRPLGSRYSDEAGGALTYDVVVIGGGHAGVEAASAAARLGCSTLLVTPDLARVGQMSCNPAIGGVAKGVVAREVAALGGVMGAATDASRIHFRMLNMRKGPAVWGPRAQCDRGLYPRAVRRRLDGTRGLDLFQDRVRDVVVEAGGVAGVRCEGGLEIQARAVVVTAGTFLRGRIHVGGAAGVPAGRAGEPASESLARSLEHAGIEVARFKTGTPPRIDGRSVDYTRLERQPGEGGAFHFDPYERVEPAGELPCWIVWTGSELKRIVRENLERSALYGGEIAGRGPRYCPSIEDKVVRFPDAPRHQVFLEPEGLDTTELYVNGLSTSLPRDVQLAFLRTLPGLEEVRMTKTGYAIEYDYFPPSQLRHSLEHRGIEGLFLAGQVNGTTGYEEAAAQGIVAGVNAALKVQQRPAWILERDEAYIGVLIDDLITRGVDEPYRLFTSRAEFRLLLRQDNVVERLGDMASRLGLLSDRQEERMEERRLARGAIAGWFRGFRFTPEEARPLLERAGSSLLVEDATAEELVKRPELRARDLAEAGGADFLDGESAPDLLAAVEVEIKYEGYVQREAERARRLRERSAFSLAPDLPYRSFLTLSHEAREKLEAVRPATLAQAGRIPGVSPADLQNLVLEVRKTRSGLGQDPLAASGV
jgi:tRNA uridine 5-carboxymethylaminomethyl modification enzyme